MKSSITRSDKGKGKSTATLPEGEAKPRMDKKTAARLGAAKLKIKYKSEAMEEDDFKRLADGYWYNDEIMNLMLWMLVDALAIKHPEVKVHRFSTFFWQKLDTFGSKAFREVERWTKNVDIFDKDLVVVPVNFNSVHWAMVIVENPKGFLLRMAPDMGTSLSPANFLPAPEIRAMPPPRVYSDAEKEDIRLSEFLKKVDPLRPVPCFERNPDAQSPKFFYMDSLLDKGDTKDDVYRTICMYFCEEAYHKKGSVVPPLEIPRWVIEVPRQPDMVDCGPRALYNMQQFIRNKEEIVKRCLQESSESTDDLFVTEDSGEMRKAIRDMVGDMWMKSVTEGKTCEDMVKDGTVEKFLWSNGRKSSRS